MDYLKKLYTKYFSVNLKDYNIDIDFEINKFIFFIAIGLCVACIFINYYQRNTSLVLKKLIRLDAFSEDSAKTLAELRLSENKAVKTLILKNSGAIKKVIGVVGRKKLSYEEYLTIEKQKKTKKKQSTSVKKESENTDTSDIETRSKENNIAELDFSTAKVYILPEMREYAERAIRFDSSPIKTALYCVMIFSFFMVLILTMPYILNAASGLIK